MNSCELVTFVSSAACAIAKCHTSEELALIGAIFSQLGDTITVIALHEETCNKKGTE